MSDFINYWFKGFEKGLEALSEPQQCQLLGECGRACSQSYSLAIYQKIRNKSHDLPEFFEYLSSEIKEIRVFEIIKNKNYEVHYHNCLCELYTKGLITTKKLCICSQKSLLFNLESVFPEYHFHVDLLASILNGDHECILNITID